MQATNIRNGMIIIFDGELCKVMEFRHHTPGNLRAMVQVKLRNLRTGTQFEHRFRSNDNVEQAYIDTQEMEYLYGDGSSYHFMNTQNYEQIAMSDEDLGDAAKWLAEGMKIQVQLHDGSPIGVELPKTVICRIEHVEPNVKGGTASSSAKPATLENGVVVQVPAFIETGTVIVVDPVEGRYMERAK
jgi:elongation factor P